MNDLELLREYEPIVRFNEGELFFPVAVEDYVACCELVGKNAGATAVVRKRGDVTLQVLAEIGADRPGSGMFLRFVDRPFTRLSAIRWRRDPSRPRFRNTTRLARVGVLSRVIDALVRISLLFRGSVAGGTEAAAETSYREQMRADHHPYYGRVVRTGGYVALQYWHFYAFNDWRSRVYGVNDHEADWEQVVVYLAEQPDGAYRPAWVVFSAHDEVGDDLRRRWDDPDLTRVGSHPVVFAGIGSHSGAYLPGEYLTTLDPPAFRSVVRVFRRVTGVLLPWTRDGEQGGVGIPYVDYARGDGLTIGPGQVRVWQPVVVADDTPWILQYQGLWGNDTADPLGGERGPAGPRYERSGRVRQAWADPVGWSGLSKVPPNSAVATELISTRLTDLDAEIVAADADFESQRIALRAAVASGITVTAAQEQSLDRLAARRTSMLDEHRRLEVRLDNPPPQPGPHDHLEHRRLPAPVDPPARRRLLAVWSAVSTPLILLAVGLAVRPGNSTSLTVLLLFWLGILVAVEAVARRHFVHLVLILVTIAVVGSVVVAVAGLTVFYGWRATVAIVLAVLAVLLLVANLQELFRT